MGETTKIAEVIAAQGIECLFADEFHGFRNNSTALSSTGSFVPSSHGTYRLELHFSWCQSGQNGFDNGKGLSLIVQYIIKNIDDFFLYFI